MVSTHGKGVKEVILKIETTIRFRGGCSAEDDIKETINELQKVQETVQFLRNKERLLLQKIEQHTQSDEILCMFDTENLDAHLLEVPVFDGLPLQLQIPGPLSIWVPFNQANLIRAIETKFNKVHNQACHDQLLREDVRECCEPTINTCSHGCKGCK
jgi:hypothetical protein